MSGGSAGVAATLEDLDALARALAVAATDAAALAGRTTRVAADPGLLTAAAADPVGVARVVGALGLAAGRFCTGAADLAVLAGGVAGAVAGYRACEDAVALAVRAVPAAVGATVRTRAAVAAALLPGGPAGPLSAWVGALAVAGTAVSTTLPDPFRRPAGRVREVAVDAVVARPWVVDAAVRTLPGLLGVVDVATVARGAGTAGNASGSFVETGVRTETVAGPAGCTSPGTTAAGVTGKPDGRAAHGVADLLRRGQSVAAWREPAPGEHDTLPPGTTRPGPGQVRVDRVAGTDGSLAWVVHVPGTQDWDGDGEGSPMDMAGNVALVGGTRSAVADGVAVALLDAGVRPGQPVALVGHSQGGMTALALAADPVLRRTATVTHVVTAGSPVAGRTPPPGVQVLALEHDDDLVPRLDGRTHPDRRDRVVVRAPSPDGPWRTDAVPAHSSSAYVVTAEAVDRSDHPSLVAFRQGMAPFLDREGAACTSLEVVLSRSRAPDGGTGGPR